MTADLPSFGVARGVVLPVDRVAVTLDSGPHPLEAGNRAAVDANWAREISEKPALFDGTVVLLSALSWRDGLLAGRCHAVRYATFLYWRRHRIAGAGHAFAHAMLVAADNALVAIRMAAHTLHPGRVYFAAGSFEPEDFPGGRVDLHRNMAREVLEETGIDIGRARRGLRHHVLATAEGTVIFRRYHLEADAEAAAERIRRFVERDAGAEIEGPVIIRDGGALPEGLMPHMRPLVEWHFSGAGA
jgi:8-oxo-dGTP pyrophosphatase MutT (NUDIX family)